ncbi:MAG: trigger factor [Candidatus Gastranaerophilaceae bacterium]
MKVTLEKEPNNIIKLDIEIPAKDAMDEYNKAAKKVSEYVNISGFRKGKAPRNIVEKHVGIERIKQEALEHLLPNVFREAILENKLDVISQPNVESYNFEIGQDLKIVAKVELRPEVKLGKYKGMTLEIEEYAVPKDSFDKSLDGLLQKNATFSPVVDRPSKNTDIVVMDFDGSVNGEKIQGGAAENYSLDLANSNFIPGFADQLVGKKSGEDFDINVEFPKDYHDKKLAGQPAIFKIKLKEIKEKVLPELTDEFAKKVGNFKTVADLKADIQKFLDITKQKEDKKNSDNAIFEKVLKEVKVDVQTTMIEREAQSLLEEYKQRLTAQGYNWEEAVQTQGQENIMSNLREEALVRIKNSLVIDKIAQEENIKVEHTDLEQKIKEVEMTYHMDRAEVLNQLKQNPAIFTSLSQQALNEKVIKFLAENNTVGFKKGKSEKAKTKSKE